MPQIKDIIQYLESFAPQSFKESWDNPGLNVGNPEADVKGILLTLDFTQEIIDLAIEKNANLIISHHPILFDRFVKNLTGQNNYQKLIIQAIKNDIALYSMHTNLDFYAQGINYRICKLLNLNNPQVFKPKNDYLRKIVTFVPESYADKVRTALFEAGAGHIGNYDSTSYNTNGFGTFRALQGANPFVGQIGQLHKEPEIRIETIFPKHLTSKIIKALIAAHPYEEVAYDIYPLENKYPGAGLGCIGSFTQPIDEQQLLELIADRLNTKVLLHSEFVGQKIQQMVVCTGTCAFLIQDVINAGAQALLTGDASYHYFFDAKYNALLIAAGHYETEKYAIDIFYDLLTEKFNNINIFKTEKDYNFVHYYIKN